MEEHLWKRSSGDNQFCQEQNSENFKEFGPIRVWISVAMVHTSQSSDPNMHGITETQPEMKDKQVVLQLSTNITLEVLLKAF